MSKSDFEKALQELENIVGSDVGDNEHEDKEFEENFEQEEDVFEESNEDDFAEPINDDNDDQNKDDYSEEKITMASVAKNAIRNALLSGDLMNTLERVLNGINFAQATVASFSNVVDKAQQKIESTSETTGENGLQILNEAWLSMFQSLMQTEEFQQLLANILVQIVKDG
jgi:hypothetical protein